MKMNEWIDGVIDGVMNKRVNGWAKYLSILEM